jgi:hypothetical protein
MRGEMTTSEVRGLTVGAAVVPTPYPTRRTRFGTRLCVNCFGTYTYASVNSWKFWFIRKK